MSRVGKYPVEIPAGVQVAIAGRHADRQGQARRAEAGADRPRRGQGRGQPRSPSRRAATRRTARMMWGTTRALVANMVQGVSAGYAKSMEITGTGFRAAVQGKNLVMNLGYSHDVVYPVPDGHQDHLRAPDRDQGRGRGQAPGRPGCCRNPGVPPARALQGQGREVRGRDDPPQGRQEEVMSGKTDICGSAGASACASSCATRPAGVRACRCSAPASTSTPR